MINTASLENSKRLFELAPEWNDTEFGHYIIDGNRLTRPMVKIGDDFNGHQLIFEAIAPDLEWLLDKLPQNVGRITLKHREHSGIWFCKWDNRLIEYGQEAGTPSDAACLLIIKLIEQNIIKAGE